MMLWILHERVGVPTSAQSKENWRLTFTNYCILSFL